MNWTKNRPTQPGWYWWRLGTYTVEVVHFEQHIDGDVGSSSFDGRLAHPDSEWAGPLEEPEEPGEETT